MTEPEAQTEAPKPEVKPEAPATAHVVGEEAGLTTYPAALATHEAVLEDQQLFTSLLQDLNAKLQTAQPKKYRPSKYRVPIVAGRELNLHLLYRQVTSLGGAIAVTADSKWQEVVSAFNFTSKINLASIRRSYSTLLWHFEQVYQHKAAGQKLLEPPELPPGAAAGIDTAAADGQASRPSRNRRGTNLAAILAATDNMDSDADEDAAPAAGAGKQGRPDGAGKAAGAAGSDAAAAADGNGAAGDAKGSAGAGKEAAAASKPARKQQQQQQSRGTVAAPAKTPELVGFLKSGKPRKDLTGQAVSGRVDAKFDCGYFVSLTIAGQSFNGILYCPTAMAAAAAAGASGQAAAGGRSAAAGAAVKKEEGGAAAAGGNKGAAAAANGSSGKREAGAAGVDGDARGGKRRRSQGVVDANAKPKSAKTAFNFFAAEQWPVVKAELGPNAIPQEISRAVGEKWNRTTDAERAPYIAKSLEDKSRWESQMAGWRQGMESPGPSSGAAAAAAAGAGTPGKPPLASRPAGESATPAAAAAAGEAAEPMDVDAGSGDAAAAAAAAAAQQGAGQDVQQYQHKKLKFKLGLGSAGKGGTGSPAGAADGQPAAAVAAAAEQPAEAVAAPAAAVPAAEAAAAAEAAPAVQQEPPAASMEASPAPAPAAGAADATPAAVQQEAPAAQPAV